MVVPAAASAVVVDPTDALMCVGATSGAIFLRALNVAPAADAAALSAVERTLDGHRQAVTALVFTLDGKHLVSGSRSPLSPRADTPHPTLLRGFPRAKSCFCYQGRG